MAYRRSKMLGFGALLAVVVLACSTDIEKPNDFAQVNTGQATNAGNTEGGFPDSAKADTGADTGDGGACTDLAISTGNPIDKIAVASDAPAALGGNLVDGIYDLNDYSYYVGISGVVQPLNIMARRTIRVDGTAQTIEDVYELTNTGKPPVTTRGKSAYTVAGSALSTSALCPVAGVGKNWQYTATAAQIVLNDTGTREGFTFLKRR